jgi:hypothetical protein
LGSTLQPSLLLRLCLSRLLQQLRTFGPSLAPLPPPLQRSDCKDSLALYDCATWQPRAQFPTATADLADLAWAPDGGCLAVWESPLHGHALAVFTPEGDCLARYSAYKDLLGVKAVGWSPSGQLLALGDYEQVGGRHALFASRDTRAVYPCSGKPIPLKPGMTT